MTPKRHDELVLARDATRDPVARREFMKLMGAALGLAGVSGCTRAPSQEIVPYVVQPPEVKPGKARFYSSAFVLDGYATGILVESHEGRPTKIEGNPDHPASLGGSGVFEQAQVLSLYDPRRARGTKERGNAASWESMRASLTTGPWTTREGRGLHFLLEPTSSPSVIASIAAVRKKWPGARFHFHAAASRANAWEGARQAFGRVVEPRYDLENADVIVALDADFLATGPAHLRLSRHFAGGRRLEGAASTMNRLYAVEALLTVTGATADHRLRVRPHDVALVASALLAAVAGKGSAPSLDPLAQRFVGALARDLLAHRGRSAILAGDAQPPAVHAAAHAINALLGSEGHAVRYGACPIFEAGEPSHDLRALAGALDRGEVDTLIVAGPNVGHTAPELRVAQARQSAYAGLYEDETAAATTYSIALAHPLESWGDARAFDGTLSVVQPLIEPLFGGRTLLDIIVLYTGGPHVGAHTVVRERFASDAAWRDTLRRGVAADSAFADLDVTASVSAAFEPPSPSSRTTLEIVFPLDLRVHDGRFSDNAWLLELPASITKLTWENAATIAPETAAPLGVVSGDELSLTWEGRTVTAPALLVPGQAAGTIGLSLGWGRGAQSVLAHGRGASAYALRGGSAPWMGRAVTLAKTGHRRELALTQTERSLQGRDDAVLHHTTLAEHRKDPKAGAKDNRRPLPLYDVRPGRAPHQWGMAIDLSICTGCTACVVACQSENNVPVVGRDGVLMGRAMHWIRIDSYFDGDVRDPAVLTQPMLCQHCEKAPCEYVCPVNATVHSTEGLNEMVYNRCVGTRFCSNNCPYKVRRFNWFDFHHDETETEQLVHNPDVTVRERGVMEKCTFCVQRIREHEIHDRIGAPDRAPLQTACEQACPTRAITFGDVGDPASAVSKLHASDRAFAALNDLGTVPRVRYLARIKNPNPELA